MSEVLLLKCPYTLKLTLVDTNKKLCPYCNSKHNLPQPIANKKDFKFHQNKNMWMKR